MPVYEFHRPTCDTVFSLRRPVTRAGDPASWPKDGEAAQRIFNPGAVLRSAFRERHPVREDPPEPAAAFRSS